ncbi:hypothetical protein [Pseudomaricurvus sp. HS19]|uniref:hypothetical protein n=1 Tax=Pseudomaricurvus sp. HS19 TaxID=2692626 RepID=UPI00136887CD|nr:hypothetical protein [Pseudomaricurvus sp. HS19]MYM64207.1 hypothetical protein [Pseudomaricurvus sp. HS19]
MKTSAVLVSVLALSGVQFALAGDSAADKDFIKSFSSSFMQSCVESSPKATCSCVLDDLVKKFSPAEMEDTAKVSEYVKSVATPKCQK